jgi:capsular polysaccharide biosynthesis protein
MNEQPLSIQSSLREIWRRRVLILVVACLCAAAGVAYGILAPAKQSAIALVLLPANTNATGAGNTGNTGATGNGISTNAVIAKSTPVLAAAGAKVSPPLGATGVKNQVTVTPISGQVLQIQAEDPTSSYAVQLANAVAASYVIYIGQLEGSSARAAVSALKHESNLLTEQIDDLQTQIDTVSNRIAVEATASSAGQQDTVLLGSLKSEQNQVSLQLNGITSQITNAQLSSGSTASTTRILQKATIQPVSKYSLPIEAGIIGFILGLLGSGVFVLVRLQRGHKLRLRDEIARVASAPVVASLEATRCNTPSDWRELLEERPRATTEWALRHILRSLPSNGSRLQAVRVISFAGDSPALTTGPRLALHAASAGTSTAIATGDSSTSTDRSLLSLRAAFAGAQRVGRGLPLKVDLADTDEVQILVSVEVFDGSPSEVPSSDAMNLLSISPNFVTADELAQLSLAAADRGFALDGVVVVNPDPNDNTTGVMKEDTVRLLPAPAPVESDDELVHLGARASQGGGSQGRLNRQER